MNADGFLQIVRKYSSIAVLSPNILHEFIDKIVIHHREKVQKIEIYYKMIGQVQISKLTRPRKDGYKKSFGRKKEQMDC